MDGAETKAQAEFRGEAGDRQMSGVKTILGVLGLAMLIVGGITLQTIGYFVIRRIIQIQV